MCAQKSRRKVLEIIALGFYDGATEGFVLSLGNHGPCYFKILAWDCAQEQRLFACVEIDGARIEELTKLLMPNESLPNSEIWIPEWKFRTASEEMRADDIVDYSRCRIRSSGFLVLGSAITVGSAEEIEFGDELARHVTRFLTASEPDELGNWMSYFS